MLPLSGQGTAPQAGEHPANNWLESLVNTLRNFSGGAGVLQQQAGGTPLSVSTIPNAIAQPQPSRIAHDVLNFLHPDTLTGPSDASLAATKKYVNATKKPKQK